jgi:hypothetical protein
MYTFLLPVENHRSQISVRNAVNRCNILSWWKKILATRSLPKITRPLQPETWADLVLCRRRCAGRVMELGIKPTSHGVCSFLLPNPLSCRHHVPCCLVWSQTVRTSHNICTAFVTLDALRIEGVGRWVWNGRTQMSLIGEWIARYYTCNSVTI